MSRRFLESAPWLAVAVGLFAVGCGSVALKPTGTGDAEAGDPKARERDAAVDVEAPDDAAAASDLGRLPITLSPKLDPADAGAPVDQKGLGSSCANAAECASGFCSDGVCCGVACGSSCVACNLPGRAGVCWPIGEGRPDPHGQCVDEGSASCGTTGVCDGFGACAKVPAGTVCVTASCVAGSLQGSRVCDGRGTCGAAPAARLCAPYSCGAASCLTSCASDRDCQTPAVCVGGACRVPPTLALASAGATGEIGGAYGDPWTDDACPSGSALVGYDVAPSTGAEFLVVGRIRPICGALKIAHAGFFSVAVGATSALPERGTSDAPATRLLCPPNQIVVGYDGRDGALVDQLSLRCAPLLLANNDTAVALGAITTIGPAGGPGGTPHGATDCGPAEVAVGARTVIREVMFKFAMLCATVSVR